MVYVKSDGTISNNPPIFERIFRLIFGVFAFIIFFFKSLLGMDTSAYRSSRDGGSTFGGWGGSGGGGGGGGRPFGPGRPGGRPNIRSMGDINRPTVQGVGGCPGGGCGM